jgi:hypothetical protein
MIDPLIATNMKILYHRFKLSIMPNLSGFILLAYCSVYSQITQTFTTSGTFTVPAGVTSITVECWGGGGAGGGNNTISRGGGGGGGGAYSKSILNVTAGTNYIVTVGNGGVASFIDGGSGSDTWFGSITTVLAAGGQGGKSAQTTQAGGAYGSATNSVGTIKFNGGTGGNGNTNGSANAAGGGGGSSAGSSANGSNGITATGGVAGTGGVAPSGGGNGGTGGFISGNPAPGFSGNTPGGGGGGAGSGSAFGGNGANGQVKVTYADPLPPYVNPDVMYVYTNGTSVETIVFTLSRELNLVEGANVSGFSVSTGSISSAIYSGKGTTNTITLTSASNGTWTTSTTVSYSSGNVVDLAGQSMNNLIAHAVSLFTVNTSQIFTASGTYTVPAGITSVTVECWGGGGSGGGSSNGSNAAGGGGGGAYSKSTLAVTPGGAYTVTVGTGALGVVGMSGAAGGDTWFGTSGTILAKGGNGGTAGGSGSTGGAGGLSTSSIGTTKYSGGNGGNGFTGGDGAGGGGGSSGGYSSVGGNGGAGITLNTGGTAGVAPSGGGSGGTGGATASNGSPGVSPGGGGGGSGDREGSNVAGGNGANGQVKVSYLDVTGPSLSPDVMTFYARGSLAEKIDFKLNKELSLAEGATVTGFSVSAGSISLAVYTGKGTTNTITLTSSSNGNWTSSTTVSYSNGNVSGLNNQVLSNFSNHAVTDYSPVATQTFTTSGTFTVPAGNSSITVECWGAGGGGGGNGAQGGGGGGGGAYSSSSLAVTVGAQFTLNIGAGGNGTASIGSAGGDTWFGSISTILAKGGSGGVNGTSGTGGAGGSGVGSIKYSGGAGGSGGSDTGGGGGSSAGTSAGGVAGGAGAGNAVGPGSGGTAPTGGGNGGMGGSGANGLDGNVPGGGGGGAADNGFIGGKGGNGQIKITLVDLSAAYISPDVITLYTNGSSLETMEFTLSRELDLPEGASVTGFTVNTGPISTAIYSGKGTSNKITLTSVINGAWSASSTVSYSPGNAIDLLGQNLTSFSNHVVIEAPTSLSAGDIAFTGYNSGSATDEFSFVLLKDISSTTVIYFTDNGWDGSALQTAETTITWTAGAALQAGTAVKIYNSTSSGPLVTTQGSLQSSGVIFNLDTTGDNLLAYQGSTSSPTFIAGLLNSNSNIDPTTEWTIEGSVGIDDRRCALPSGLTNEIDAMSMYFCGSILENLRYNSTFLSTGSAQQLRAAINTCGNWTKTCCSSTQALVSGVNALPIIPVITNVSIPGSSMIVGNTVNATLTVHDDRESIHSLSTSNIDGFSLNNLIRVNSTTYSAQFTVAEGGTDVASGSDVPVSIRLSSSQGNLMPTNYITAITQSGDQIDANSPRVLSINRQSATNSWSTTAGTSASSVIFRITFSENINASTLNASDFSIPVTGSISGAAINSVVAFSGTSVYDVTVAGYTGTGTLGLNYVDNNDGNAVQDLAGNSTITSAGNTDGDFTGQLFSIVLPSPTGNVSGFAIANTQPNSITVQWSNTVIQATHCLVMLKETTKTFPGVSDGTPLANDNNMLDGVQVFNVTFGTLQTTFSGLSTGTSYNLIIYPYSYSSNNTTDNIDYYTVSPSTVNGITIPAIPVATSGSSPTASSFVANWNGVTGASTYVVDYSINADLSGATTITGITGVSTTISGLTANTTYHYRVRAVNTGGTSGNSNIVSQLTLTLAPVANAATNFSSTGFTANWSATTGASSYRLDVANDNGFSSLVNGFIDLTVNSTSTSVTGLLAGNTYFYRVRSVNGTGPSTNSNIISQITIPPAPVATNPTLITSVSFTANWQPSNGAANYKLDVSVNNFTSFIIQDLNVTSTSHNITGLSEGASYQYRVRAENAAGISIYSNTVTTMTVPPVPVAAAGTAISTSGFTTNWSTANGAAEYLLDISADNFSSFLPGYNSEPLAINSNAVSGLQPNTTYQYRVRAKNSSGISGYSNSITVVTYSLAPTATAATLPNQTGFTANWNTLSGITNFKLDVSADDFVTRVTGFDDLTVTGASKAVTGLSPGIAYKYRLRALNSTGPSANSNSISAVTIPANPVASAANAVSQTGFTANWNSVTGADGYLLEVSQLSNFSTLISSDFPKSTTNTSEVISGLSNGTTYYFRLKSQNTSGNSNYSNTISQITIPQTPTPNPVADQFIGQNSFTATWTPVIGVDYYEIDVTLATSNFATFIHEAIPVPGNEIEETIGGLAAGTSYYFRMRAVNAGGKSPNSIRRGVPTKTDGGGPTLTFAVSISSATSTAAQIQITNPLGTVQATFYYKGITEDSEKTKDIPVTGAGTFSVPIDETMSDDLGIEFYVKATDESGVEKATNTEKIFKSFNASSSPSFLSSGFDGKRGSIKIISIPYDLKDNLIESIFSSLGEYNKQTWRLAHYDESLGKNVEYGDGINKIERGLGYWFNAKGEVNLKSGEGSVGDYSTSKPFPLSLVSGWNQIGNPYPFAIDWSDVLADNPTISGVGSLKVYKGSIANYDNGNKMEPFTGGFVHSENDVTLNVKVSLKNTANGGRSESTASSDLADDSWRLPLIVYQSNSTYSLAGIGMEPTASSSKDSFDDIRLPRLEEYVDLTFHHPESRFPNFTQDVLPTYESGTWRFFVESNQPNHDAVISWDHSGFGNNEASLLLFDVDEARLINMRLINSYSFNNPGKKDFRIYYNRKGGEIIPDVMAVGKPFPNPAASQYKVSLVLPEISNAYDVNIILCDMMGKPVNKLFTGKKNYGFHTLEGTTSDYQGNELPSGVYFLRSTVNNQMLPTQRVVIKK